MKFKLARPVVSQELCKIISREIRRQKVSLLRTNKNNLKEMAKVCGTIKKRGLSTNLVRKKLPGGLGYGIFLHPKARPILKGQVIGPYSGKAYLVPQNFTDEALYAFETLSDILLTKEEQSRFDRDHKYHPRRLYALYVDALKKGNFTRFINHSDCPNLISDLYRIPKNSYGVTPSPIEVLYLAKKTIQPGEQLLVCYDGDNHSYWGGTGIKPVPITPQTFRLTSSLKLVGSLKKRGV
jgi:hypothetical protein